jgi:hypothetical protein
MFGSVGAISGRGVKVGVHYIAIHALSPPNDLFFTDFVTKWYLLTC